MASSYEKSPALATTIANPREDLPSKSGQQADEGVRARAVELATELEALRDRFRKTTNALGSAAHDLKTPLAILNGYIELLQSENWVRSTSASAK